MWRIVVVGPNIRRLEKALGPGEQLLVGRARESAVLLPADYVSRRHVQVSCTDQELRVCDFGTRNGTLLNGHPLGTVSRPIAPGDVLQIGEYRLSFEAAVPAGAPVPPQNEFITLRASEADANPFTTRCSRETERTPAAGLSATFAPLLFEVAEKLVTSPDELTVLRDLLDYAQAATGFDGVVLIKDDADELAPLPGTAGDAAAPWSKAVLTAAASRTSALLVNHLPSDPRFFASRSVELGQHQRVLCAPMQAAGQTLGALYLWTDRAELPGQDAVHFVGALAQLGATALRRRFEPAPEPVTSPGQPSGLAVAVRTAQTALASIDLPQLDDATALLVQQAQHVLSSLRLFAEQTPARQAAH